MAHSFASLAAIYDASFDDVIDVRSPAEFAEDHVPGAISLPVLSNDERAEVGTIYKQVSPFKARKIGAALVARNAANHITGPLSHHDGSWKPLVYCWRGGQRSGSFASILSQIGWRADVIEGGYRAYRRLVADMLHETALPHDFILLDGNTGTAKTELLARLADRGAQVLDLEGMARHRGSLFGATGAPQPAQKAFESALAKALTALDPNKTTILEAESSKVGSLIIPPSIWANMTQAPRIQVTAPLAARAKYLTTTYVDMVEDPLTLSKNLQKLVPFHGHAQIAAWQQLAHQGAFQDIAAQLMETHYDSRYAKSRCANSKHVTKSIAVADLNNSTLDKLADTIVKML